MDRFYTDLLEEPTTKKLCFYRVAYLVRRRFFSFAMQASDAAAARWPYNNP
jgi:hypothetical protein